MFNNLFPKVMPFIR